MLGPSGFFIAGMQETAASDTDSLELIHVSEHGFNALYRGCKNGRFFVYKALKEEYRGNIMYEELLKKDFNIGFSLNHIGICQYYAMIDHPETGNCIVMEWIDGISLEGLLKKGKVDGALAKKIIYEICEAMEYMHRKQIIHRDIKPENIMITHNGNNVKIIDFGLSDGDSYSSFKSSAGTMIYASPELLQGDSVDHRSDIWSLGVIISELGRKYRHVSQRCMRRDREKRYASAAEVKKAILMDGYRKLSVGLSAVFISAVLVLAGFLYADRNSTADRPEIVPVETPVPAEEPVSTDNPVQDETLTKTTGTAVKEAPAKESMDRKSEATEHLDATDLEDLFNEASRQIL